jgi:DNA-binding NarL/FixJ family response regulator
MPEQILIVDDHSIVRRGYRSLLAGTPDLEVVGEAGTGDKALSRLDAEPDLDLLITDLQLPGMSGLELIRRGTSRDPSLRVLAVSMYEEAIYGERALKAGAHGYVRKTGADASVVEAARTVLGGDYHLSDALQRRIVRRYARPGETGDPLSSLTDRELEVFEKIGLGLSTREIADRLFISIKTVQTHRKSIQKKLGIDTIEKLIRRAVISAIRASS